MDRTATQTAPKGAFQIQRSLDAPNFFLADVRDGLGLAVVMSSNLADNLILVGSVGNIIVVQLARARGVTILIGVLWLQAKVNGIFAGPRRTVARPTARLLGFHAEVFAAAL